MTEEIIFRGLLVPRNVFDRGVKAVAGYTVFSTAVYVGWHPVYAIFINPKAAVFFLDPRFLAIAALLGVTCSIGYAVSKSLWVAILTHWATVMVWVFLFAGRNLVLD